MNILVCDDRRKEANAPAVLLNDPGCTVHTSVFDDGYDALEHIRSGANIDVCFLDIVMPNMSGVALANILRKVVFRLTDGIEIEVSSTLNQIATKLPSDPRFIQCHRSFIVNMDDIPEIFKREIITRGKKSIPISKGNRDTMKIYFTHMFGDNKNEQ